MSIRIMAQVFDAGPTDKSERLVMLALADFCNDEGECWPAVASIARKAAMTERGARKILRRLEESGWLKTDVGNGRGGCSQYRISLPENPEPRSPRNPVPPEQERINPEHGSLNPEPRSPEPSRTIKEPSIPPLSPHDILCEILRPQTATDFIAHRKALRKPVTAVAAKRLVNKVRDHPDPDSVFDESIANGWQGVFPDRSRPKGVSHDTAEDDIRWIAERYGELDIGDSQGRVVALPAATGR